jgi:hypothetical protein
VPQDMARPLGRRRRTEPTALPGWIKPQLTKLFDQPPEGEEWLHELKYYGPGALELARPDCTRWH